MEFINPSLQTLVIFSLRNVSPKRDENKISWLKQRGGTSPNKCHQSVLLHVHFFSKAYMSSSNIFLKYHRYICNWLSLNDRLFSQSIAENLFTYS